MCKSNEEEKISFWNFINGNHIEIPIIQRDYAQGREGEDGLREKFIRNLKSALDGEKELTLDFIYGNVEQERFSPLDGQQRLTTLWLLHWYIASKVDKIIENETQKIFNKFSYETRASSKMFCEKLSVFSIPKDGKVVESIENQTWFFKEWKKDPTIRSMMLMLESIEKIFIGSDFSDYWSILEGNSCPISFYQLNVGELQLSDDLYIKMNSRGTPLTNFENFKADLISHMRYEWSEKVEDISLKLDATWTDLFWEFRDNGKIDDIYFSFINQFLLNELIVSRKTKEEDPCKIGEGVGYDKTVDEIEEDDLFKYLYGDKEKNARLNYSSFDPYKDFLSTDILCEMEVVIDELTKYCKGKSKEGISELLNPRWNESNKFHLIPQHKEGNVLTDLTQKHRVVFYAVCCYFEYSKGSVKSDEELKGVLRSWMRVVWNIVENADINTVSSMIGVMRLIDELKSHLHDIDDYLANPESKISSQAAQKQLEQEIAKAKKIKEGEDWKSKIKEAEKTAFFNGDIRVLYRDGWEHFDGRLAKAKKYFEREIVDGKRVDTSYDKDNQLLRAFIRQCTKQIHFEKIVCDDNASSWKSSMKEEDLIGVFIKFFELDDEKILGSKPAVKLEEEDNVDIEELQFLKDTLCETNILKSIIEHIPGSRLRVWHHGYRYVIFPKGKGENSQIVIDKNRFDVVKKLEESGIKIDKWHREGVEGVKKVFLGRILYFKDKDKNEYKLDGKICKVGGCEILWKKSENEWKEIFPEKIDGEITYKLN